MMKIQTTPILIWPWIAHFVPRSWIVRMGFRTELWFRHEYQTEKGELLGVHYKKF